MNNSDALSPYECCHEIGDGIGKGIISPENMPVLHEKLLENVVYFDSFCREHNLTYYLMWGSCIGAVRHHGFIPWDDDLDIGMPREDYDKLFDLWEEYGDKENFALYRTTKDFCAKFPIGVLRNKNTTIVYDFCEDLDMVQGVKIDIEPWDKLAEGTVKRKLQKLNYLLYEVYSTQRLPNTNGRLRKGRKFKRFVVGMMLKAIPSEKARCKIAMKALKRANKYNSDSSLEYVCCHGGKPILETDLFRTVDCPFENTMLKIPAGYDAIFKNRTKSFGDYMQKPPVEKRKPNIEYVFYDLNAPCEKYRGVHYCKKINNKKETNK